MGGENAVPSQGGVLFNVGTLCRLFYHIEDTRSSTPSSFHLAAFARLLLFFGNRIALLLPICVFPPLSRVFFFKEPEMGLFLESLSGSSNYEYRITPHAMMETTLKRHSDSTGQSLAVASNPLATATTDSFLARR